MPVLFLASFHPGYGARHTCARCAMVSAADRLYVTVILHEGCKQGSKQVRLPSRKTDPEYFAVKTNYSRGAAAVARRQCKACGLVPLGYSINSDL